MFENIIGQDAARQLILDINSKTLAPAMLFEGPRYSGKGSTALELGRVLSCEKNAAWNCSCPACRMHRLLLHPDMLSLGSRSFNTEIAAAAAVCLKTQYNNTSKMLFVRSVRKLLARFNPVLWEDEPKFSKLSPLVLLIEENLDELGSSIDELSSSDDVSKKHENIEKIMTSIVKNSLKLESDGSGDSVPVAQIRRAAWWSRLAPTGKRKFLLIENADRLQDGARNSLLKLLEEPPETVTIVLTTARPKTIIPTILSRLRPYRFAGRSEETEREIIRRIFRIDGFSPDPQKFSGMNGNGSEDGGNSLLNIFFDSFLPVTGDVLKNLAAFFAASAAYKTVLFMRKKGIVNLPEELVLLGKFASPIAEKAGLEKTKEGRQAAARILEATGNFEISSQFTRFIGCLFSIVLESQKTMPSNSPSIINVLEIWRKCAGEAETAVMVYNQNPGIVLEHFFIKVCRMMAEL